MTELPYRNQLSPEERDRLALGIAKLIDTSRDMFTDSEDDGYGWLASNVSSLVGAPDVSSVMSRVVEFQENPALRQATIDQTNGSQPQSGQ